MGKLAMFLVLHAIMTNGAFAQSTAAQKVIPVYIDSSCVQDETGRQFVLALRRALSKSRGHNLGAADVDDPRLRFYLEILTADPSRNASANASIASVTIEVMGLPNSYPVPTMWYHKLFLLDRSKLDEFAGQFVADMDAHWCNHIMNSVGNCPKESIPPIKPWNRLPGN